MPNESSGRAQWPQSTCAQIAIHDHHAIGYYDASTRANANDSIHFRNAGQSRQMRYSTVLESIFGGRAKYTWLCFIKTSRIIKDRVSVRKQKLKVAEIQIKIRNENSGKKESVGTSF
mmetsp:Transcript_31462/g.65854  ORF Transcript_31462/g.65854 Transcript_31462/m.65854 type:complete len:117 (-) Transcript_31462:917-1267(-)